MRKKETASQLALQHFDQYYSPLFGKRWPSMRLALLSQSKYCALLNNFSQIDDVISHFDAGVLSDIITDARNTPASVNVNRNLSDLSSNAQIKQDVHEDGGEEKQSKSQFYVAGQTEEVMDFDPTDIYQYMPVKRVISEEERLLAEEQRQSVYEPDDIEVSIIEESSIQIPASLKAYCYEKGDVTLFPPPPKDDFNTLGISLFLLVYHQFSSILQNTICS